MKNKNYHLWWFVLDNERGESKNGRSLANSLKNNFSIHLIKIVTNNPFSEQFSGLSKLNIFLKEKPISVFVHGRANFFYLIISRILSINTILITNDYMRFNTFQVFDIQNNLKSFYHTISHYLSLYFCSKKIFISEATKNKVPLPNFLRKKLLSKSIVIHPLSSYLPQQIFKSDYESEEKIWIDILLITGNTVNKNFNYTLKLLSQILEITKKNKVNCPRFHLVGLNNIPELETLPRKNIINHGKNIAIKDLVKIHLNCEFYLSLSSEEGFGIPLLDSLLLGLFPIISNIDSYNEIIYNYEYLDFKYLFINLDLNSSVSSKKIIEFMNKNYTKIRKNKIISINKYKKNYDNLVRINKDKLNFIINS